MNTFKVHFFSLENKIIFDEVTSLLINGLEGELMILAHHSPYLILLLPGLITVKIINEKKEKIVVDSGVLEVIDHDCSVMTNQVQIFDHAVHDEKLLNRETLNIRLAYLSQ